MSNIESEQIRADLSLDTAKDQVLSKAKQQKELVRFLGKENCKIQKIAGKKVFTYSNNKKTYILLHKAISYLGNPHPIYKKRIQLPSWFNEFCSNIKNSKEKYDIRFIGVYHYNGLIIFVDFIKDTYLTKKAHNSSAHVYINDLYQAMKFGVFHKEDSFGNHIYSVRGNKFADYLTDNKIGENILFTLFRQFNTNFTFGQWLKVLPIVKEMERDQWTQWRQVEWPGWYLEYKFNKFTIDKKTSPHIIYTGLTNKAKNKNNPDFDLYFKEDQFYGDLKASDISSKNTPGNDQTSFIECINMHDKFWYIIYEHETIKDSAENNYKNVRAYNQYMQKTNYLTKKD
ncbi:MAG: hypothetical protein U0K90_02915 [Bacteroidales bacterium]|nr:hypothetical protein [Bacteroidales bacterium]